jgi:hypothetical protein
MEMWRGFAYSGYVKGAIHRVFCMGDYVRLRDTLRLERYVIREVIKMLSIFN